jgi:hypothetical protein
MCRLPTLFLQDRTKKSNASEPYVKTNHITLQHFHVNIPPSHKFRPADQTLVFPPKRRHNTHYHLLFSSGTKI